MVDLISIFTAGDSVNMKPDLITPYRMVGVPDGLGAFDNGDGTFTVLMNHELPATAGVTRAHGSIGAFVTKLTIRKSDLTVLNGQDLVQSIFTWNTATSSYNAAGTTVFNRLCSADLPPLSALYNAASGKGFNGRLFMNGEEFGPDSAGARAFAHELNGTSWELPFLGKYARENVLARPTASDKTVVMGINDDNVLPGQLYVYIGDKSSTGNPVEMAEKLQGHPLQLLN